MNKIIETNKEKEDNNSIDEELLKAENFDIYCSKIRSAIEKKGWKKPMKVQAHVAPYLLNGQDIIVQSKTGSGKTAAFLLPLCEKLKDAGSGCQALLLVPTRELASQVYKEFADITEHMSLKGVAVYGGASYRPQLNAFKDGVQVVIGTPGRILDHLIKGSLSLKHLKFLVFDEADELLSMGFFKDIVKIGNFVPQHRTSSMFSATMPDSVRRMAEHFLHNPKFLGLSGDGVHVSDMDHVYYVVDAMAKDRILMRIFEMEDPESAIIFCNTKSEVEYVSALLKRFGYDADQISGDLKQSSREKVMGKLKTGQLRFLVATDVAARGIDISNLEYVIIYDMHKDFAQYIHRAGRTARAGKRGVAISLVTSLEAADLKRFAKKTGIELIAKSTPSEDDIKNRISEKLLARLESELRDSSSARRERSERYEVLANEINEHENGKEIIKMLLDGFHQAIIRMGRATPPVKTIIEKIGNRKSGERSKRRRNYSSRNRRDRK